MPLLGGKAAKTTKGFGKNVKAEMAAGKPQDQAVAIAYGKAGEGKTKAPVAKKKVKKDKKFNPNPMKLTAPAKKTKK